MEKKKELFYYSISYFLLPSFSYHFRSWRGASSNPQVVQELEVRVAQLQMELEKVRYFSKFPLGTCCLMMPITDNVESKYDEVCEIQLIYGSGDRESVL